MSRIHELLAEITDTELRQKLEAALSASERRQSFGLFFDEHVPETLALPDFPVRVGATVVRRSDIGEKQLFLVRNIESDGLIEIQPLEGGAMKAAAAEELLVVRRIDDPVFLGLRSLGVVRRGAADRPSHALINGENHHALQLLRHLFEGQVDCIYIDPPYNTGSARVWKYSGRYVDSTDGWRHGKWLSMMEKRLRIAAHLLKPDGVLICTIDEHEVHHLGMLLEKVFRGYVHYMITVVINPKGREKANFAPVEEFAFFVVPDSQEEVIARAPQELSNDDGPGDDGPGDDGTDEPTDVDRSDDATAVPAAGAVEPQWEYRHARRRGGGAESSSYRRKRHNQFYPIYIDEKQRKVVRVGPSIPKDEVPDTRPKDGLRPIWPIDKEGHHRVWAFVSPSMQRLIDRGDVSLGKYHKQRDDWTIRYRVPKRTTRKLKTVWWKKSHDAGTHGTEMLKKLLGAQGLFSFPKSVYAVEDCLAAVVRNRPQALIVDFFAGSGTTFHATCLLNAEDGGTRRSILVTHNEVDESTTQRLHKENLFRGQPGFEKYGIFERVARPRSEAVVTGLRRDGTPVPGKHTDGRRLSAGFPENLEFFQLEYLDRNEVDLRRKFEALYPALWLAADGVGDRLDLTENPDMLVPANAPYAILLREELFGVFLKSIQLRQDIKRVWLVTDSEDAFAEMRARLAPEIRASMLYRDYLRNFAGSPRGLV